MSTRTFATLVRPGSLARLAVVAAGIWVGAITDEASADGPDNPTYDPTQVSIVYDDITNTWIITAADGSIINYDAFDVDYGTFVQFIQPGDWARVLNRVNEDYDGTQINGSITANGIVFFVNPAGVFFGNNSVTDVGGIFAAAGHIDDGDFQNDDGQFTFYDLEGDVIVHDGAQIYGDAVHLIGQHVANYGHILSDGGVITMVAGNSAIIQQVGERIIVRIDTLEPGEGSTVPDMTARPGVENSGIVEAGEGQIHLGAGDLYSLAIQNYGTIRAAGGEISVAANDGLIHNGGTIDASNPDGPGGSVVITGPSVLIDGEVLADSDHDQAGSVEINGTNHVYLRDYSLISAAGGSGVADGGTVTINNPDGNTVFMRDATIDVSGGDAGGNGGAIDIHTHSLAYKGSALTHGDSDGSLFVDGMRNIVFNGIGGNDSYLQNPTVDFSGLGVGTGNGFVLSTALAPTAGHIHFDGTGSIYVYDEVILDRLPDFRLSGQGIITIHAPITGAKNLYCYANTDGDHYGWVSINVPLFIANNAVFSGEHIRVQGHSIISGGTQEFWGHAYLGTDNVLTGKAITFYDEVDTKWETDPRALVLNATDFVRFAGNVGGVSPLQSLTTNVGGPGTLDRNLVLLDCNLIRTVGDVRFNPAGRDDPAHVATIVGRGGDLRLQSLEGDILMGPDEKLTVLGDLTMEALNGRITLADLNTDGDMLIYSPDINIWGRDGGRLYDADGDLRYDVGADFVATGSISFSSTPFMLGSGHKPFFAYGSGESISDTLSGFNHLTFSDVTDSGYAFMWGDLILDLSAGFGDADLATAFTDPTEIADRVYLDPFALRAMERLAIDMRGLNPGELVATTEGTELYNDSNRPAGLTATNRLRRSAVLNVLEMYSGIFVLTTEEGEQLDQTEHVREVLAAAWADYAAQENVEFRPWLEENEQHAEALAYLDSLRSMFNELHTMGLSAREMRSSVDGVLAPVTPDGVAQAALEAAILTPVAG